ncbi:hypothetical protein ABID08_002024 [Rhizobium binae]|uniref:Uncharacterized protein n=1 Tax=Rhizobium binae TaxID=1138190 RepID=A0ABV2MGL2_9HYPH|nr:hypothetical protein [Rhizobium binae]MBX4992857.1 hypothetical protein [Rhizobium binae]NKL49404.1 hypothetical protein [Rhizobium leguminosarum bv. viciae]QSY84200.1 hypothetical protein J2J99_10630 [Rhizobium binae]
MQKHWDSWGWAATAILVIGAYVGVMYGGASLFSRDTWCYGADDECLREWMSALGGWVAVVVAVPTIIYLSKQVRAAEKHHRTTIGIQARPTYMLAQKAAETSVNIRNQIASKGELWEINNIPSDVEFKKQAIKRLGFLKDLVDRTEFIRIQSEIEVTYMRHEQLLKSIDESIDKLKERYTRLEISPSEAVIGCSANSMQYLDQVKDVCDRFIRDFERMTDHPR